MKTRIIEIMTELWEAHKEFRDSRPDSEQGYLVLGYNTLFSEAVSCWRGEQAGKNRFRIPKGDKQNGTGEEDRDQYSPEAPATQKQIYYIHKNNLDVNTEKLTKREASKIIEEHKKNGN